MKNFRKTESLLILEWQGTYCRWEVSCLRRQIYPEDLRGGSFLIGVSLRNPRFSNAWLQGVLRDLIQWGGRVKMCVVDAPYLEELAKVEEGSERGKRSLARFWSSVEEQERRLVRLASGFPLDCEVFRWREIERMVPSVLVEELKTAFSRRELVHTAIAEQVQLNVRRKTTIVDLEKSSLFLQREIPVLVWMYYKVFRNFIDVYPGVQANFFWELERGTFREEVPYLTELASSSEGLVYADVSNR